MHRRWLLAILALAVWTAACSSSDDSDDTSAGSETSATDADEVSTTTSTDELEASDGATDGEAGDDAAAAMEPGSQVGITDDEINFSMIYSDTTPYAEAGLIPEFGSFEEDFDVFIELANEQERFGGRTASITHHPFDAGSTPADQTPACIAATEDRDNFVVFTPGGIAQETILCVVDAHETLMLSIAGSNTPSLFEQADGRFFNNAISIERLFDIMIGGYAEEGRLDGATIGVVRPDEAEDKEVKDVLEAALADHGFEITEDVALPCEGRSCSNVDIGVERLRTANVDAVFSLLGPLEYPEFVGAAGAVGYTPQWYSSDYENQAFDTTGRWMQEVREFYDGAIATTSALSQAEPDPGRQQCNDDFTSVTGKTYEPLTDAWYLVGNVCELVDRTARVIENIEADGLEVGQDTFIAYMEKESAVNGDRMGAFGPDKHDAYDVTAQVEFDPDCKPDAEDGITVCWKEIEGSRKTWEG